MNERIVTEMLPVAAALAVAVDEEDPSTVEQLLTTLSKQQLYALAVVLAAHIDPDQPFTRREGGVPGATKKAARKAAEVFQIHTALVMSEDRHRQVVDARVVAYYAAHLLGETYSEIGRVMNRDHTTVSHGCGRVGADPRLRAIATAIAIELGYDREDTAA